MDGVVYYPGSAGSSHNNCLIFSLSQLLQIPCNADEIRARLRALHPRTVTETNFLDFSDHTFDLLGILLSLPSDNSAVQHFARDYTILCVDANARDNGAQVGRGHLQCNILRVRENHFVPIWRARV